MGNYTPDRSTIVTNDSGNSVNIPQSDLSKVIPRQIGTGNNRGEMTIKGLIRVVDSQGNVRLILGYKKGAF
jgi:hypothetical protein